MSKYVQTLVRAFFRLTNEELGNMLWHQEQGTEVLCGKDSGLYAFRGAG